MSHQSCRQVCADLLAGRASGEELERVSRDEGFKEFVVSANLAPLLYAFCKKQALEDRLSTEIRKFLKRRYANNLLLEDLRCQELTRLSRVFSRHSIPCLVVKGTALAYTLYPEPHVRARGDTDLLIPEEYATEVAGLLEDLGYAPSLRLPGELTLYQFEYSRELTPGFRMALDVHWRLSNLEIFSRLFLFKDLQARAISIPRIGFQTISPVDALLLACVHRVAHHGRSRALIWLFDIYLLAEHLSAEEAEVWAKRVEKLGIVYVCRDGLSATFEDFRAASLQKLLDRLPDEAPGEVTRVFLENPSDLQLLWWDLKSLSWKQRFRWLREQLFPPAEYMRAIYGSAGPLRLAYLYCKRIVWGSWVRSKAKSGE